MVENEGPCDGKSRFVEVSSLSQDTHTFLYCTLVVRALIFDEQKIWHTSNP